jgi:hypothetical protein
VTYLLVAVLWGGARAEALSAHPTARDCYLAAEAAAFVPQPGHGFSTRYVCVEKGAANLAAPYFFR